MKGYTLTDELRQIPVITTEQLVEISIRRAITIYREESFMVWAECWLSGKDRTRNSAHAAEVAADSDAADDAAGVAADSAAAAYAYAYAYAADAAAYAYANAADDAADAYAYATRVAVCSICDAEVKHNINILDIIKSVLEKKEA